MGSPPNGPPEAGTQRRRRRRPVVSVCIANWNCLEYLRACLATLTARLQGIRLEIIVVDNASTDGAPEMVAREFPRVRLIRNAENRGFSRANNQAAAVARGRFLFFLNNDTEVPPGTLRQLVAYAREHPEASIVAPRLVEPSGQVQLSWRSRPKLVALLHRTLLLRWTALLRRSYQEYRGRLVTQMQQPEAVEIVMGAAMLLRRKIFRKLGGWDEGYQFGREDIDLCLQAGKLGPVIYHPGIWLLHHGRVASRQAVDHTHGSMLVGLTRCLRRGGASSLALLGYKLAVTLSAPLDGLGLLGQYFWRRLRGQSAKATKSLMAARGTAHFLTRHLLAFWRA